MHGIAPHVHPDPSIKTRFHVHGGSRALAALGMSADEEVAMHAVRTLLNLATAGMNNLKEFPVYVLWVCNAIMLILLAGHIENDVKYLDIMPALQKLSQSASKDVRMAAASAALRIGMIQVEY